RWRWNLRIVEYEFPVLPGRSRFLHPPSEFAKWKSHCIGCRAERFRVCIVAISHGRREIDGRDVRWGVDQYSLELICASERYRHVGLVCIPQKRVGDLVQ